MATRPLWFNVIIISHVNAGLVLALYFHIEYLDIMGDKVNILIFLALLIAVKS